MRTLGDIREKREDFYKGVKEISFKPMGKDRKGLLEMIGINCSKLYRAIDMRRLYKVHNDKSESDKYLENIKTCAYVLRNIGEEDDKKLEKDFKLQLYYSLKALKDACMKAGNAKFSKTTFGAVLDYKPTQEKFIELMKEIEALMKKLQAMYEENYIKRNKK